MAENKQQCPILRMAVKSYRKLIWQTVYTCAVFMFMANTRVSIYMSTYMSDQATDNDAMLCNAATKEDVSFICSLVHT